MPTPNGDLTGVNAEALPYSVTVFESAARTDSPIATTDAGFGVPKGANALVVYISVTAVTATPSVVFNIEGYDKASGTWYTILASAAVATVTTSRLRVVPGGAVAANVSADDILPETIRIRPVHADTDSITYSVGAHFNAV